MSESRPTVSWGIVVALALALTVLQVVAGPVVAIMLIVVRIAILVALGYFLYTLWRNNRNRLQWLNRGQKALFYGAGALIVLVVVASFLISWTLLTALLFFAIIGGCGFVMWRLWRETEGWY